DPDLAPFDLSEEFVERCRARVPELPDAKRDRYVVDYGLKRADAAQIAGDPKTARFFEEAVGEAPKFVSTVANVVVNLVPATRAVTATQVASISTLLAQDAITFAQAREVLEIVDGTNDDPARVVDERGMRQSTNMDDLAVTVDEVLARCEDQVRQYREGNKKVVGFLVGQCMKASRGTGNPKLFNQLLRKRLDQG
ncbi:MAG: Asp-tRNA(Asn)/Glu-tRNA(Gln) amidotransferase GatCAB subunit B, partial [Atopobiaceae bacterium]|nr:Asp-tRNA(Asn)/Glu-tRNA(Gln) amidotransferase GatCAB subunit B [Atopobiaceae bacterium]